MVDGSCPCSHVPCGRETPLRRSRDLVPAFHSIAARTDSREIAGETVVGTRYPVTTPPDGSPLVRKPGIAFRTHFVPLTVDYSNKMSGTVVEG
jgi:hypothetical protein